MTNAVFPIIPTTQQYDWGKIGLQSKVAQFSKASSAEKLSIDEKAPYAELWMGTHPSSPSRLLVSNDTLSQHLASYEYLVGNAIIERFQSTDGNIPFLFKVLAIEKALSIQTHPDKAMAERLHAEQPKIYKDSNHKPEMAIALTPFAALCGFRPLPQIAAFLTSTPELTSLIPTNVASTFLSISNSHTPTGSDEKAVLKELFSALMNAEESKFVPELNKLIQRYKDRRLQDPEEEVRDLILKLHEQFPGDIGVFCPFVLNYVKMQPGEAIFLGAGEPHAYIYGDIMECMATSDNVIRAGLTPKLRDIPNLVSGLTYIAADPSKHLVKPQPYHSSSVSTIYDPPVPEFSVIHVKLPKESTEIHEAVQGPSIVIVTAGNGQIRWKDNGTEREDQLSLGRVFFVGAGVPVEFKTKDGVETFRAFVENN
ncbi:mannose-6-phosphate isomerase [Rickenella mellea]|uniref:Mannose-6-phosphate isomerase n=1 Tax=Rickenella mellea TaxID=50990 RepID=A0A4R5XEM2_9AGAM|nr:mannose-6-phosphate isomerase [Rickenella mellea]